MGTEAHFLSTMCEHDGHAAEGLYVTLGLFFGIFGLCLVALAL